MKIFLLSLIILFLSIIPAFSTVWIVRDGGGTPTQCTGTTNAIYPGSGSAQPCAINHPSWVIGTPGGTQLMSPGDTLKIVGDSDISWNFVVSGVSTLPAVGDTYTTNGTTYTVVQSLPTSYTSGSMILSGNSAPPSSGVLTVATGSGTSPITYTAISTAQAQFKIGYGMPNPGSSADCAQVYAYDCGLSAMLPGISASQPTTIIGIGSQKPQLWGTQGTGAVLNISPSSPSSPGTLTVVSGAGDSTISFSAYHTVFILTVSGITIAPSIGDEYTNNGITFTIVGVSISGGVGNLSITGSGTPTYPTGTLTVVSGHGSGDSTISVSNVIPSINYAFVVSGITNKPSLNDTYQINSVTYTIEAVAVSGGSGALMTYVPANLDVENLEITDHSPCSYQGADPNGTVDGVSPACTTTDGSYPYGTYTKNGVFMAGANITTKNNLVHRVSIADIYFLGVVQNWNSSYDTILSSGQGGALTNANAALNEETFTGTNTMNHDLWAWGGCSEHYPTPDTSNVMDPSNYHHCCDQTCGGYSLGGGFMQQSTYAPCGSWIISNSKFLYNLKTNIDFLHCASVNLFDLYRSRSEGSSGEALKIGNATTVNLEQSQLIGNAPVWYQTTLKAIISPNDNAGNPTGSSLEMCRGNAVTIYGVIPGEQINYLSDDVTGNCTALVEVNAQPNSCTGTAINTYNTKFLGGYGYDIQSTVDLFYNGGDDGNGDGNCASPAIPFNEINDSCYNAASSSGVSCTSGTNTITTDPKIVGESISTIANLLGPTSYYNGVHLGDLLYLQSSSPLIGKGSTSVPYTNNFTSLDFNSLTTNNTIGALQSTSCIAVGGYCDSTNSQCCTGESCSSTNAECIIGTGTYDFNAQNLKINDASLQ